MICNNNLPINNNRFNYTDAQLLLFKVREIIKIKNGKRSIRNTRNKVE